MLFAPSGLSVRSASNSGLSRPDVAALGQGYLLVRSRPRITRDGGQSLMAVAAGAFTAAQVEVTAVSTAPPVPVSQATPTLSSALAPAPGPEVVSTPAATSMPAPVGDKAGRAPSPSSSSTSRTSSRTLTEIIDDRSPPSSPLKQKASQSLIASLEVTTSSAPCITASDSVTQSVKKVDEAATLSRAATSASVQQPATGELERFRDEWKAEIDQRTASPNSTQVPAVAAETSRMAASSSSSPMAPTSVVRTAAVTPSTSSLQPATAPATSIQPASAANVPKEHARLVSYLRTQLAAGAPRVMLSQIGDDRKKYPSLYGTGTLKNIISAAEHAGVVLRSTGGTGGYVSLAPAYRLPATNPTASTSAIRPPVSTTATPAVASGSVTVARAPLTTSAAQAATPDIPAIPVQYRALVTFLRVHHRAGTERVTFTAVGEHRSKNSSQYGSERLKKLLEAAKSAGIVLLYRAPGGNDTVSLVAALR
jgi:hypothetical protein